MRDLPTHRLSVALVHPQIPQNVGNVGRTCVATGTALHLVRPMAFVLEDARIKRAGLDYWPRLDLTVHDNLDTFTADAGPSWWFDSEGETSLWDCPIADGDTLVFGSETRGFPPTVMQRQRTVRLPQVPGERCLNLSSAVAAVLYHALHRVVRGT
ncbi:MAG: tRNA (cytidine(34)-2'-O)-methyltransferase [Planctomycetota bacterium]